MNEFLGANISVTIFENHCTLLFIFRFLFSEAAPICPVFPQFVKPMSQYWDITQFKTENHISALSRDNGWHKMTQTFFLDISHGQTAQRKKRTFFFTFPVYMLTKDCDFGGGSSKEGPNKKWLRITSYDPLLSKNILIL